MEYFESPFIEGEYYENGEYQTIRFEPEIGDLDYLRTFKFEDLTFRGTIEFRSVCCQPIRDCMTVAAFHLGLKNNLHKADVLLSEDHVIYHHGYTAGELRKMFVRDSLPSFVDRDSLYDFAQMLLDTAKEGLTGRGYGEEALLEPLYKRLEEKTNPARHMLDVKNQGGNIEDVILEYAQPV